MKKIVVPDVIKIAVMRAIQEFWKDNEGVLVWPRNSILITNAACEAFAKAMSENPIVPTDAQIEQIHRESNPTSGPSIGKHWENRNWLIEWQRIMFKNHEPEAPESIKDLRKMMADYFNHSSGPSYPDDLLVEAYRRGLAYAKRPAP